MFSLLQLSNYYSLYNIQVEEEEINRENFSLGIRTI